MINLNISVHNFDRMVSKRVLNFLRTIIDRSILLVSTALFLVTPLALRVAPPAIVDLAPAATTDITLTGRTPAWATRWPAYPGLARRTSHEIAAGNFGNHHTTLGAAHSLAGFNHGFQRSLRLDIVILASNIRPVILAALVAVNCLIKVGIRQCYQFQSRDSYLARNTILHQAN